MQKTYDKIPSIGESHAHVMNLLPCDLGIRISSEDGIYNNHFNISSGLNSIVYDLKETDYKFEVRANEECPIHTKMMKLPFAAQGQTVAYSFTFQLI